MIKLRLRAMSDGSGDTEINFKESENLLQLVTRAVEQYPEIDPQKDFQVLVNAMSIPTDLWEFTAVKEEDQILIAPKIRGGDFGQTFKSIFVVVVTVVASVFLTPAGGATIGSALAVAAVSIGAGLLINSLIPPPNIGGLEGFGSSGFESSQMYSISSQSNAVKKFGYVAKTYGTHRTFPVIAANPYTEIEADPSTGDLVQFFYAIYDFGFGPALISDIRIGDTPITDFADVSYRLVDLKRPDVSEGIWDDYLEKDFLYYKGDSEIDNTSLFIDANQEEGGALEDYQIIRNAAPNPNNEPCEILLTFVNPQGLIAYGTQGDTYDRSIDLEVEFQRVGDTVWHKYNSNEARDFRAVGGDLSLYEVNAGAFPYVAGTPYTKLSETPEFLIDYSSFYYNTEPPSYIQGTSAFQKNENWGYPAGTSRFIMKKGIAQVGYPLKFRGANLGLIISVVPYDAEHDRVQIKFAITFPITVYTTQVTSFKRQVYVWGFFGNVQDVYWEVSHVERVVLDQLPVNFTALIPGKFIIRRRETGQVYTTVRFTPRVAGEYRVRVTRLRSYSTGNFQVQDRLALASITTRFNRAPILTDKRHVFLELRIRATNQLNGAIQNLSAVTTSVLDTFDGTNWVKQPTSNPAWVFADLMTGQVNKRAIDKARLHGPSLLEWSQFCDEVPPPPPTEDFVKPRFESNFVLDYETTLQQVLNQVCNAAQASLNIIDGKYGVLIDKKRTVPVQIFTPRNSSNFSSTKNFFDPPHALKIKYIDPAANWELREKVVYADGFDEATSTTFDELTSFACTNAEQAWRFGRYMMAQSKLRQETISLTVDFEYLVCTRGDYVQITQDVMKVGGTPARVKAVSGNVVTIDEGVVTSVGINYGYVARAVSGGITTSTLTVISADQFQLNGTIPAVGDLIVIGEIGKIVYDCLVKAIQPNDDMSANLILIEKADAVYDAESSSLIPNYSPQIAATTNVDVAPPKVTNLAVLENSYLCGANSFEHYIKVDWDIPAGTAFEYFEVYVSDGRGFDVEATTRDSEYTYYVDNSRLGLAHEFKILAVSSTGKKIELIAAETLSVVPAKKTARPMNVPNFSTNITGEVLQLDWDAVNDCIREYLIRYTPQTENGRWEASIPLLRVDKNTTMTSTQARTGTYLIKAIDFNDNESETATVAITTIPNLFGLNVIDTITDFPTLVGAKDRVRAEGSLLVLRNKETGGAVTNEYFSEGYYYYNNLLNLGEIYTVRLQSLIQAEGYTVEDLMVNWNPLANVLAMSNARYSEWDVQTEYRGTNNFNVIAEWNAMSDILTLNEGSADNFTPWRKFTIGDATARIFQFRLKLISNKASVTPRVYDGTIKVDVPDRIERVENIVVPVGGLDVAYTPAFMGPGTTPAIQISIDNGQTGDYWEFEYKTLSGFKIIIYDNTGVSVERTIDVAVSGYGRRAQFVI